MRNFVLSCCGANTVSVMASLCLNVVLTCFDLITYIWMLAQQL